MEEESKNVVVIDVGSKTTKCGFAGDDAPRKIFPTYVGYTKKSPINLAMDEKAFYVGEVAKERRGRLDIHNPVVDSLIENWEDIENLWSYCFFDILKECPDETNLVLTESPLNPPKYREKTVQILFELFNLEGVYLASKCLLSLYSTGRITGCVVESGHGVSYSVPIYEGYTSPHNITKLNIGGRHLDNHLNRILFEKGYEFTTPLEWELISEIKEKLCYVHYVDLNSKETKEVENEAKMYYLPDDSVVRLTQERHEREVLPLNHEDKHGD
jgi:actin-related protein